MTGVRHWLAANLGGLPSVFWRIFASTLINRLGGFVAIYLSIYLVMIRDFEPSFAGLVIGLYGGGGAVGVLIGGVLADRWGRKPTVITANLLAAGVAVALGLVTGRVEIAVLTALLGAFTSGARPALSAMTADVVPEPDRLRAFSLNYWAINLGFSGAALLAGVLAGLDYRLLFFIDAVTTATSALVISRIPETRPASVRSPQAAEHRSGGIGEVLRDRVFLMFVVTGLLTWMMVETVSMLPVAMEADGLPAENYGMVIAVNGVMIVLGQLFVPRLVAGADRSRVLALAAVIVGVGFGAVAFADTMWMFALTVAIWTVGEMLMSPAGSSLLADLAPARLRGRYNGVHSLGFSAAAFTAPILAGATVEYVGETALWLGCLGMGLIVAVLQLTQGPARNRRIAQVRRMEAAAEADEPAPVPAPAAEAPASGATAAEEPATAPVTDTEPRPSPAEPVPQAGRAPQPA